MQNLHIGIAGWGLVDFRVVDDEKDLENEINTNLFRKE